MNGTLLRHVGRALAGLLLVGGALGASAAPSTAVGDNPKISTAALAGSGPSGCKPTTVANYAKKARGIFTGTVISISRDPVNGSAPRATFTHEVTVDQVYQGGLTTKTVKVLTSREPDSCALGPLSVDQSYLFFAQNQDGVWVSDGDSGTTVVTDKLITQVERLRGAGRDAVPAEPEQAVFTPVAGSEPTTLSRAAAPGAALVLVGLLGLLLVSRLGRRA